MSPSPDEIANRVILFLRRMLGRIPDHRESMSVLLAGGPTSARVLSDELRNAGELLPYEVLVSPSTLTDLKTVGELIEMVANLIYDQERANEDDLPSLRMEEAGFRYEPGANGFITVPVWFATDRERVGDSDLGKFFGPERSNGKLFYGVADVTIPNNHKIGQLEGPTIWRFEFKADPTKHVVLARISDLDESGFFRGLREVLATSAVPQAFVFIHGYNVTFKDAARRAGQIARDLAFNGAPILYSWPSQGAVKAYPIDATNAQWTVSHLEWFLGQVATRSGAKIVHVIAHSMGNLALVYALQRLALREPIFNQIALAAPDIDASMFADISSRVRASAARVTLYASNRDRTLWLSRKFNGYQRVGDASRIVVVPGVDTIDASLLNTDVLGHSYFGNNRTVLSDIHYVVRGIDVSERAGMVAASDQGGYWTFIP